MAVEPSSSWAEDFMDTFGEDDGLDMDMTVTNMSQLGFPSQIDAQGEGSNVAFEYDLNNDIDFDAMQDSLTLSAGRSFMPGDLHDAVLRHDAVHVTQNTDEFFDGASDHLSALVSPATDNQIDAKNSQSRSMNIEPCAPHSRTCMASVLKVLQALHIPSSMCLSAGSTNHNSDYLQPRLTDHVLSTNKEALRLISDAMDCICSSSSQLQLVIAVLCNKITTWCRAMVRKELDRSPTLGRDVDRQNINHEDHIERVLHQPITIGEYSVNATLENKIRAQVVWSQLEHVERLAKTLSRCVQETDSPRSVSSEDTGTAGAIHKSLMVFLYRQLQAAKVEVTPLLKIGHG